MKYITILFFLFSQLSILAQTNKDFDTPILGTWEGTITLAGKSAKVLRLVVQSASFNSEKNLGRMMGYSTVNGTNKTEFEGTWYETGNHWPTLNLNEPKGSPFNGVFTLDDCANIDHQSFSFWDGICGTWISYNKKLKSNIFLKKVSERTR
jgi:hypothetical protein